MNSILAIYLKKEVLARAGESLRTQTDQVKICQTGDRADRCLGGKH
jgi:hypothetical protein